MADYSLYLNNHLRENADEISPNSIEKNIRRRFIKLRWFAVIATNDNDV